MSIKVLIADDHEVVREGLTCIFQESGIDVVDHASDGNEACEKVSASQPDIVLMDIRMPGIDGIAALSRIREEKPDTRVIMLSTFDNPTYVARSIALGASDYILKGAAPADLVESVKRVAQGDVSEPQRILSKVKSAMADRKNQRNDVPLTNRETQVLRHIALGLSNREIGVSLNISIETVKEHVQNILRKINASDRTHAAIWAVRKGLIE